MDKKYFFLSSVENSKLIKSIQIIFGAFCIIVAIYWLIFSISSSVISGTVWITILFLSGFGFYQIWSGIGKALRFIEISSEKIRLKKTVLLPPVDLIKEDIDKIEIFPFSVSVLMKSGKKIVLRLSSTYYETNAMIKDEILNFGDENNIACELIEEKL